MFSDFLVDGAGRRSRIEVRSPLHAAAARLMASLGVEVTVVSAQELLRSRDCAKPGCVNEAISGGEHCSTHREGAVQPVVVAAKAPAGFEALWCDVCKDESTANRSGECSWCGSPLLDVDGMKARLAQQASALSSAPRVEVAKPEPEVIVAEPHRWTRETIIQAIQEWARRRGHPPGKRDWIVGADDRPTAYVVLKVFTTWADAIAAAGFPRPSRGGAGPKRSSVGEPKGREAGATFSPSPAKPEPAATGADGDAVASGSPSPEVLPDAGSPADDYSAWLDGLLFDANMLYAESSRLEDLAAECMRRAQLVFDVAELIEKLTTHREEAA